jgi:NADP-dependent 3-hydroxy acid dehydrogenase YdfG
VTGASSGIGETLAATLAADSRDLAITARRGDRLRTLAGRLARYFIITGLPGTGRTSREHVTFLSDEIGARAGRSKAEY